MSIKLNVPVVTNVLHIKYINIATSLEASEASLEL